MSTFGDDDNGLSLSLVTMLRKDLTHQSDSSCNMESKPLTLPRTAHILVLQSSAVGGLSGKNI